ncbi:MAG: hypothetical protein E4H01_07495 [Lysobacterales bacterium]|nr:MAG: hypothetical protein E4H01_07495 [Xanthomonadales bacterium]
MSKFHNPVEIKISALDLIEILTTHMNAEIFRDDHQVQKVTMHVKGEYACTMIVDPIKDIRDSKEKATGDAEKKA